MDEALFPMDARVISAFTRVFDALLPAHDESRTTAVGITGELSERRPHRAVADRASRTSLPRARNQQCVGGRVWSRLGQQPAQIRDGRPQMMAMDDHIDHAVLLEIFGALEAVGEFLADGLLDDARPGNADERTRPGDVDVAE